MKGSFFIGCPFHIKDESFCEEWLFFIDVAKKQYDRNMAYLQI